MPSQSSRVVIVANRLPVSIRREGGSVQLVPSSGGLATGLSSAYEQSGGTWVGWPGDTWRLTKAERAALEPEWAARSLVPVHLSAQEVRLYYETFSNGVIWPLFHYLLDRIPLDTQGWESYVAVNRRFAEAAAAEMKPGDLVWVHDYQLMLVPGMLRELVPEARIGFFLHIPFPAAEVFRILPWREGLLMGVLGADLVAFHTASYARHFATALRFLLGLEADVERAWHEGREVRIDAYPMGIDAHGFEALASRADVRAEADRVREESGGRRILLGVDRLDYTKGIPRRMLAFERLLEQDPSIGERVRFIQVAVPTRTGVEHYQAFRRGLEETIGRINGAYGTLTSAPIHYVHRTIAPEQLSALYRAADVMLVTPLRDGMNLVAKEFVASRCDNDGVLILSEFAGAASELGEAVIVNPYDIDGMAAAMRRAVEMPAEEQRTRMTALRARVGRYDVHRWTAAFLEGLQRAPARRRLTPGADVDALIESLAAAGHVTLLLDYDGTLVPIVSGPALAVPDPALLTELARLASTPGLDVQLVSGRARDTLEEWLGELPIGLWAEHGLWHRPNPAAPWKTTVTTERGWMEVVRPIVQRFVQATPGSLVEEKTASFAWHYRMADPELGALHGRELAEAVRAAVQREPVEILEGSKVIEIRLAHVGKGVVVAHLANDRTRLVAIGDDRTDEDMFAALPPTGVAVHVGPLPTRAGVRLRDWRAARELLARLADARELQRT